MTRWRSSDEVSNRSMPLTGYNQSVRQTDTLGSTPNHPLTAIRSGVSERERGGAGRPNESVYPVIESGTLGGAVTPPLDLSVFPSEILRVVVSPLRTPVGLPLSNVRPVVEGTGVRLLFCSLPFVSVSRTYRRSGPGQQVTN